MTLLNSLTNMNPPQEKKDEYQYEGEILETNIDLFNQTLEDVGNTLAFVTEEQNDCNIIKEILKTDIKCETQETDLDNERIPIVKIINDDGKYDFKLIQSGDSHIFSSYKSFTTSEFINLFKSPDIDSSGFDYDYSYNYGKFLQLQSLFTKFLIKKKGETYDNKQFLINMGTNSYPPNNHDILLLKLEHLLYILL